MANFHGLQYNSVRVQYCFSAYLPSVHQRSSLMISMTIFHSITKHIDKFKTLNYKVFKHKVTAFKNAHIQILTHS